MTPSAFVKGVILIVERWKRQAKRDITKAEKTMVRVLNGYPNGYNLGKLYNDVETQGSTLEATRSAFLHLAGIRAIDLTESRDVKFIKVK